MKNIYNVNWSDEALSNLEEIIKYFELNWTRKEINSFFTRLEKNIEIISKHPMAFPASASFHMIRRCVLSEQTSIYYEIKNETVVLLSLSNNRKKP